MPDLTHLSDHVPQPAGPGGPATPPPQQPVPPPKTPPPPNLTHLGDHVPPPAGPGHPSAQHPGGPGAQGNVVQRVPLPGGGSATIGQPDAHGDERLTIHEPNGHTKQYELVFGQPGHAPKQPGVTAVRPDAHGQMVIHDGNRTLVIGKPGPHGVSQVTVHGPQGATHRFHLAPPHADPTKFDAPPGPTDPVTPTGQDLPGPGGPALPDSSTSPSAAGTGSAPVLPDHSSTPPPSPGATSGSARPSGDVPAPDSGTVAPQQAPPAGGGGMPMSGGGAPGKGGDTERKSNKWAVAGDLFDGLSTERSERLHNFLEGRPREQRAGGNE